MTSILQILRALVYIVPFVLLCVATRKLNLNKADRGKQFLVPVIALLYCIIGLVLMDDINNWIVMGINYLKKWIPFLGKINLTKYLIYIFNALLLLVFLIIKGIALPILKRVWGNSRVLMENTSGYFYEYEEDIDKWLIKKEYGQVKFYYNGIYYGALTVSAVVFTLSQLYPEKPFFQSPFYPVFGMIVLGEVINFLSGITKSEFVENILGEDEESYKIANYGLLRNVLRDLFEDRVLYDVTMDNGLEQSTAFETLDEMCKSEEPMVSNLGKYFMAMKEGGEEIDPSYVKSCVKLIQGQSTLFCNPFYRDLTNYLMFPMIQQLMKYRKCLVIMGRDSSTDDVKAWLEEGIYESIHTESLWKVQVLDAVPADTDIGILKFCDLHNLEIQKNNEEFLSRVGFVFIVEPSRILATGQMGLSLLVNCFDESKQKIVYSACDRNCDGLVDAMSHILKTNITEVTATTKSGAVTSLMCWEADGEYMHHKIFSNVSRYLGIGTEINSVAMKYQIANTAWISSDKFPVLDMKWIAGQYYKKICGYTNLPVSQDAFDKAFHVESNLWNMKEQKNSFLVVEDEFQNLFELTRLFATRAKQQGFINVISENYLLRDYMLDNVQTFISDPKAIPTIVADYARTERNTILKLIMRMSEGQVGEDEIVQALTISGIKFADPFVAMKNLIRKHCFINEINIRVYFRETLMEDTLRTEVRKYYAIEGETEIAEYAQNLKNAYYIAEDEKGETYHVGAKLYGHVFQALIPGQFLTYAGKYYEVQSITPQNGVVVRRAADHITERRYYRQLRHITLTDWNVDESVGGQKIVSDMRIEKGYCQIKVDTEGYLEMQSYGDLKTAKKVCVSGIPSRSYRNKLVMKLNLPDATERVRYTICLLLNEIFKTTYPDSYPYICAVTPMAAADGTTKNLNGAMYTVESDYDDTAIYIVEDSEIDLGLIASVERNLNRYFEMISEILTWHENKMNERPVREEEEGPSHEFEPLTEEEKNQGGFFKRIWKKIKGFFKRLVEKIKAFWAKITAKKPKPEIPDDEIPEVDIPAMDLPEEEPIDSETPESDDSETDEAYSGDETEYMEEPEEDSDETVYMEEPETDWDETVYMEQAEEDSDGTVYMEEPETDLDETVYMEGPIEAEEDTNRDILRSVSAPMQILRSTTDDMDVEGEEEQSEVVAEPTEYQKNCFLKFGFEEFDDSLDLGGTASYLTRYGYEQNPLGQVRERENLAGENEEEYNPNKPGAHFCDFCGVELAGGEYELLHDGRERCNRCSSTALRTGEEFKEVFKTVMRNMELFFGIKFNVAIKVRMTDAKKIAAHFGEEFVPTPGFDGRTLGFAKKDSTGYSIYVENGSPKLAAMSTIAHELTHIWQYQNWDDRKIVQKYGAHNRLEIYEGMAKWVEIQYLMCLNEMAYAKRQEILTLMRDDEYGRGFIRYRANYPFTHGNVITRPTPFNNPEEPLALQYAGAIKGGGTGTVNSRKNKKKSKLLKFLFLLLLIAGIILFVNRDKVAERLNLKDKTVEANKDVNPDDVVDDDTKDDVVDDDTKDDVQDDDKQDDQNAKAQTYAYNQLNDKEKATYTELYKAVNNFDTEFTGYAEGITQEELFRASGALITDHPEIFWYQGSGITAYAAQNDPQKIVTKAELTYCMTKEEAQKRQSAIDAEVNKILAGVDESMTDYEIALHFYESIINLCDYDSLTFDVEDVSKLSATVPDNIRSIYGVFGNKKAVCVGYARAFQYLATMYGIECTIIDSDTHSWNLVNLEGDYYYLDATWGDGTNTDPKKNGTKRVRYGYFCFTTAELNKMDDHTPTGDLKVQECTATKCNYFYKEGLLIDSYNYDTIKAILLENLKAGQYNMELKFKNADTYKACMKQLVDNGDLSKMIQEANKELNLSINTQYSYYQEEILTTLAFEFKN